ncbi:unnamed protein product [Symbiodinium natans]|uniref:Uncharacterized protein n=1 Tax=Symbiodinium natans TaxID=878477 RepID=A0A812M7V4_9DINO|nr:unnamed protein product [Symbiodinium natans]
MRGNTTSTTTATNTTITLTETETTTFTGTWFEIHTVLILNLVTGNSYLLAETPGGSAAVADIIADQAGSPRHLTSAVIVPRPLSSNTEEVSSTQAQVRAEMLDYRRTRQEARAVASGLAAALDSMSLTAVTAAVNARLPVRRVSVTEKHFGIDITSPTGAVEVFRDLAMTTTTSPTQEPTGINAAWPGAPSARALWVAAAVFFLHL